MWSLQRARLLLVLAATSLVAACTHIAPSVNMEGASTAADTRSAAYEAYMRAAVDHDHFSGTVLIAFNGVPVFRQSYGMANYELGAAFTPDTVFNVGSLTKQFTAAAILRLQEQGRLNVENRICAYLDNCPDAWRSITIRHLLTHTSGIPNYSRLPNWDEELVVRDYTPRELVDIFRDLPLEFTPGEHHRYSNSGYHLLAMIIERVTGASYASYLSEQFFVPLAMTHTRFNNTRALVPGRATGYYSLGTAFRNASLHSPTIAFGSSGIFSTAGDLLIWDQALHSNRVLSQESRDAMFTPFLDNYAYGLRAGQTLGRRQVNHSGSSQGFSSFMVRFLDDNVTVIVLSNSDAANATRVALALSAIYFGAPYDAPTASLHDILWDVIAADGVEAGKQRYLDLARTQASAYDFEEDETLVELGYSLYEANALTEAQTIFEFAIERFPRSAYSYDGLADIAAHRGDFATAIRHFQTSLGLDPENDYAIRGLALARQGRRMH